MILQGKAFFNVKEVPPLHPFQDGGRDWGKGFLLEKEALSPNPYPRKTGLDRRRGFLEMRVKFYRSKGEKMMDAIWKEMYDAAKAVQNGRVISQYVEAGGVAAAILVRLRENLYRRMR